MMTTLEFLNQIRDRGIQVWIEDGSKLKLRSPKGALTPAIKQELRDRKRDIISFLDRGVTQSDRQSSDIIKVVQKDKSPLSFAQERLWFVETFQPGSPVYLMPEAFRITGSFDLDMLEQTIHWLIDRHEAFRTGFMEEHGEPFLQIHDAVDFSIDRIDLEPDWTEQSIKNLFRRLARESFDLAKPPLLRISVIVLSKKETLILVNTHHLISDFISSSIFQNELWFGYTCFASGKTPDLAPLPLDYSDFTHWQRKTFDDEALSRQLDYWRGKLADLPIIDFPASHPRPALQTHRGSSLSFAVDRDCLVALRQLAKDQGASLFMVLLAAFKILVYRYTRETDIAVGTSIGIRQHPSMEQVIGLFVNLLVMRTHLKGDASFLDCLRAVRETALEAYAHQQVPFEKVVEACQTGRDLSRHPLFQLQFFLTSAAGGGPKDTSPSSDLQCQPYDWGNGGVARVDLTMGMLETDDDLSGSIEFNTDLFDQGSMSRLADHFCELLRGLAFDPAQPLDRVPIMSATEQAQIDTHNQTISSLAVTTTLHRRFEAIAAANQASVAVAWQSTQLSYETLNHRANQWARLLQSAGVGPEVTVGLCLERTPEMIIAILAILKAGGAYVPIDPHGPTERLNYILEDARVAVLLTETEWLDKPKALASCQVLTMDQPPESLGAQLGHNLEETGQSDQAAYIIYTSGSTGRPKGTLIPHANALRLLDACQDWFGFDGNDNWSLFHSVAFDFSVWEIWGPLLFGGKLVIVPYWVSRSPDAFRQLLIRHQISVLNQTPSAFSQLQQLEETESKADLALRWIIFGGEALHFPTLESWYQRYPEDSPRLVNMYGITETTVHVTYRSLSSKDLHSSQSLIGERIPDLGLFLLDPLLQPVPIGIAGEICVAGAGLARGYLRRPSLTASKFVPHPNSHDPGARLYRSGDAGRWLDNGDLVYVGRLDSQVKLRGFRIELGEITHCLQAHATAREAFVQVLGDDNPQLVAYMVPEQTDQASNALIQQWTDHLNAHLPAYMIPAVFVILEQLPLNQNGKIDRAALPAPEMDQDKGSFKAPLNQAEALLCELWSAILGRTRCGRDDHFFELGGHSLLATQLVSRVRQAFQVDMPIRMVFEYPTPAKLWAHLEANQGDEKAFHSIVPRENQDEAPLSFSQERMWFLHQLEPDGAAYHVPVSLRMPAPVQQEALRRAFDELVRRHQILRTRFEQRAGHPVQIIDSPQGCPWIDHSLSGIPVEQQASQLDTLLQAAANEPFSLENGPLIRVVYIDLGEGAGHLFINMHHIIVDGWSLRVLMAELNQLYLAFTTGESSPLPEPTLQFGDYAAWQRDWLQGPVLEAQWSYWETRLNGANSHLEIPTDRPRPSLQTTAGNVLTFEVDGLIHDNLQQLCKSEGVTPFMALCAAFSLFIAKTCGQDDVNIGTVVAGRTRADTESLIGFFVNTLVLRFQAEGALNFRDYLAQTRTRVLEAFSHQDLPFEQLVDRIQPNRDMSRSPLFQVMFSLENETIEEKPTTDDPPMDGQDLDLHVAKFDLNLTMFHSNLGLSGAMEYNTDLFDRDTITQFMNHYQELVRKVLLDPELPLSQLTMSPAAEHTLLATNAKPAVTVTDSHVLGLITSIAVAAPNRVALIKDQETMTYGELNRQVNQLALALMARGVGPESRIGICMPRSFDLIIAILGTLKCGAAYVPLDPQYPADRLAFIIEDAKVAWVLTDLTAHDGIRDERWLTPAMALADGFDDSEPQQAIHPQSLAYVIYTSGSTGKPKGVGISHASLLRYCSGAVAEYQLGTTDRILQFCSINFDPSVEEIFTPLIVGAQLVLHTNPQQLSIDEWQEYCGEHGVSVVSLPTAYWHTLVKELTKPIAERMPQLRLMVIGGEKVDAAQLPPWQQFAPGVSLLNSYGPSETTVAASYFEVGPGADLWDPVQPLPIGKAMPGYQLIILDNHFHLSAQGVVGELAIAGQGLARGYLGQPIKTAQAFLPNPYATHPGQRLYLTGDLVSLDSRGDLKFHGRSDGQVKIRGHRIELGEIDAALSGSPLVAMAVVNDWQTSGGERRLAAYIVPAASVEDELERLPKKLQHYLIDLLPGYMVPSEFVILDRLPLTTNGKVDRKQLPIPQGLGTQSGERVAPRNDTETTLAEIWTKILGSSVFGVTHSFFEVGGNSLLAVQLVAAIEKEFGRKFPLSAIFRYPSIGNMAQLLIDDQTTDCLQILKENGIGSPWLLIHPIGGQIHWYLELAEQLTAPVIAIEAPGLTQPDEVMDDIPTIAKHYLAVVRERFPSGNFRLFGWSFGGSVAFEMGRQLAAAGQPPEQVVLFDALNFKPTDSPDNSEINLLLTFASELAPHKQLDLISWSMQLAGLSTKDAVAWVRNKMVASTFLPPETEVDSLERFFRIYLAHERAGQTYSPPAYDGEVMLIRAQETVSRLVNQGPYSTSFDWQQACAQPLRIHDIPGGHYDGLTGENLVRIIPWLNE